MLQDLNSLKTFALDQLFLSSMNPFHKLTEHYLQSRRDSFDLSYLDIRADFPTDCGNDSPFKTKFSEFFEAGLDLTNTADFPDKPTSPMTASSGGITRLR